MGSHWLPETIGSNEWELEALKEGLGSVAFKTQGRGSGNEKNKYR